MSTIYVDFWPTQISTAQGTVLNPFPDQCRAAGYELASNSPLPPPPPPTGPTPEQIAAQLSQMHAEAALQAQITDYQQQYAQYTQQFCALAGLPACNKLDMPAIVTTIQGTTDLSKRQQLDELSNALNFIIHRLYELSGAAAWDNLPV